MSSQVYELAEIGKLALAHEDMRRALSEFNYSRGSVQHFVVGESPSPLGQHYHIKKLEEVFIIIAGGGKLYLRTVDPSTGKAALPTTVHEMEEGSVVVVPAYTAHTFLLRPGTVMVCVSSEPFDPNNMDLNPMPLVDPKTFQVL